MRDLLLQGLAFQPEPAPPLPGLTKLLLCSVHAVLDLFQLRLLVQNTAFRGLRIWRALRPALNASVWHGKDRYAT